MNTDSANSPTGDGALSERDKKHNWHPYTQHKLFDDHIAIVKGTDALLWDENGKEYIDAIASWWVNPYAYILQGTSGDSAIDEQIAKRSQLSAHKLLPIPIYQ